MREIKPPATPGERVVHQDGVTLTSQLVRRGAARVVRVAQPDRAWAGVRTEVDQLLSADRSDAAMTVHAEYAGQVAPNACRTQQPSGRIRPVPNRPAQATDQDAIQGLTPLVDHSETGRKPSQADTRLNAVPSESAPT
jgi:hypothetical protein